MTHSDKETPGYGPGEVRTPPGLGDSGAPEVPIPAFPRSLLHPTITVTYLAGTKCSQGSRDTGRSRAGCPVPAPRRVRQDLEPRPRAGWARACLSDQKAQDSRPPLSHRSRETLVQSALGLGCWTVGRSPSLRSDWACGPHQGGRRGGVSTLGGEASGAQRCSRPLSSASRVSGRPRPSPEFPFRGRQG